MAKVAMMGDQPLFFIMVTADIPFGPPSYYMRRCDVATMTASGYPAVFVIDDHCLVTMILGAENIRYHYGF